MKKYQTNKNKIPGRKPYLTILILLALIAGSFLYRSTRTISSSHHSEQTAGYPEQVETSYQGMQITMLDVGQGLGLLIEADGHAMLYDAGGRERSSYVISYLKQHGYEHFDYMIASHYDEDHIAGLAGCLAQFSVDQVLCPDYEASTSIYTSFTKRLGENGARVIHPTQGQTYPLGNAIITILGPARYNPEDENNSSIAIRIAYGDFSCLMTGDAQDAEEWDILNSGLQTDSDLYVVGHHGSSNASSDAFVAAASPNAAWISCGAWNTYGHPAAATIATLEKYHVDIFRTDMQQEITCFSDGRSYSFDTMPCEDHSDGSMYKSDSEEERESSEKTEESMDGDLSSESGQSRTTYVVNKNSEVFHYPDCSSVSQMKEKNRWDSENTRDELISMGYRPCKNCNP